MAAFADGLKIWKRAGGLPNSARRIAAKGRAVLGSGAGDHAKAHTPPHAQLTQTASGRHEGAAPSDGLHLTVASYNIHKAIGRDRKRDAERILTVLGELDADVIALQEADLRFGSRAAVLPKEALHEQQWQIVPVAARPASMGWHGNALLVRKGISIVDAKPLTLPALEPRGAVTVRLEKDDAQFCIASMHLDLSGLIRRRQLQAVCAALLEEDAASIMLGDFNEWSANLGALRVLREDWTVLAPGRSFPSGNPIAQLDRIVHSHHWQAQDCTVHRSPLASLASDHLPVRADVVLLPKK